MEYKATAPVPPKKRPTLTEKTITLEDQLKQLEGRMDVLEARLDMLLSLDGDTTEEYDVPSDDSDLDL